jgi:predicted PurR-regulated permease PerM
MFKRDVAVIIFLCLFLVLVAWFILVFLAQPKEAPLHEIQRSFGNLNKDVREQNGEKKHLLNSIGVQTDEKLAEDEKRELLQTLNGHN